MSDEYVEYNYYEGHHTSCEWYECGCCSCGGMCAFHAESDPEQYQSYYEQGSYQMQYSYQMNIDDVRTMRKDTVDFDFVVLVHSIFSYYFRDIFNTNIKGSRLQMKRVRFWRVYFEFYIFVLFVDIAFICRYDINSFCVSLKLFDCVGRLIESSQFIELVYVLQVNLQIFI
ncbi:Hypothetical_protein [Hexamita inflata]|uniref:Hypothetical_protein n=1 Tax=Hexamita inflata TaxID=28002 RepID=A0AA86V2B0_9EUKA|nr:Hypothetical protein HINF_LOCUS65609 [Hexamita inflata]